MRKLHANRFSKTTQVDTQVANMMEGPMLDLMAEPSSRNPRDVYFYEEVDVGTAKKLILDIRDTAKKLAISGIELDIKPLPLRVHILSGGGELFSGLAISDAIKNCQVPVETYIEGCAASAATLFSCVATRRFITASSFILIHQLSSWFEGTHEQQKDDIKSNIKIMDRMKAIYVAHTKLPEKKMVSLLKHDLWLSAKEALEFGFVDEIVGE